MYTSEIEIQLSTLFIECMCTTLFTQKVLNWFNQVNACQIYHRGDLVRFICKLPRYNNNMEIKLHRLQKTSVIQCPTSTYPSKYLSSTCIACLQLRGRLRLKEAQLKNLKRGPSIWDKIPFTGKTSSLSFKFQTQTCGYLSVKKARDG